MTVIPRRLRLLAAKIETTVGTDAVLANADGAFLGYDIQFQPTIPMEARESPGGFGHLSSVPGAYMGTATFKTPLEWDGTATIPIWASVLLPACGWVNSSGTLTPRSEVTGSNVKSLTLGCYMGGMLKKLIGAVGSWRMVLPTGGMGYIEWTFQGVWVSPTDTASLTPTLPTALPLRAANSTVTFNSDALKIASLTIDSGNEVVMREDPSTVAGYCAGLVTNRKPKISADPESDLVANRDVYGDWIAQTEAAFSVVLDGPTDADITISAAKAQIINSQEGDRNNIVTDDIEWTCNKNGANHDEELSIVFNEAS